MTSILRFTAVWMLVMGLGGSFGWGQTNPTAQALPYSQDFASLTGSSPSYPAGFQGWTISGSLSTSYPTTAPNGNQSIAVVTNTSTSAHVGDFISKMGIMSTSNAMKAICLAINTTGKIDIQVSFDAATQRTENTRQNELGLQYRVGTSGTFTDISGSTYQNQMTPTNTTGTGAVNIVNKSVTLPSACNNQSVIQIRWVIRDVSGSGNRPGFSIDNVTVTGTSPSSSSDIITNSSFTYPTDIVYTSYQGTNPLTEENSIEVAKFDIRDGGGSADIDALSTILTAISFNVSNSGSLSRIALFDGTTNVGEAAGGATPSFSSLTLTAADGGTKTFSVRVSFLTSVTDNQQFSFTVSSATASGSGSGFAAGNAGGAASSTSGDNNRIEVTANEIIFDQDVSNVSIGAVMNPSPTLRAIDSNLNYDLDYAAAWSVAVTTGDATFDGTATTTGSFSAGLATLGNLVFNATGTGNKLTVTSGSFTDESIEFNVTNAQPEINIKQNTTGIASGGSYDFGNQTSGTSSSAITFTIENLGTAILNLTGTPIVQKSGTNASEFTIDQTSTTSAVNASSNTTFTVTFSPASQGSKSAQLSIASDDSDENPYLINLTGAGTVSSASDITNTGSYSYTSDIDYASYQTASTLTTGNSVGVNGLTIRDGAGSADADNLSTTLTAISISTGGSTAIRTAALFDGSNNVSETAVNGGTTITFSGLSLSASDGGSKDFELRVTFQATVTDNQQITFTVTSATASTAGSGFAAGNAGGAASTATGDINKIEVSATALVFGVNPSNVKVNSVMSPSPTVVAKDGNSNIDLDFEGSVTLNTTGTISGSATNPVSAISGTATFSNLIFSAVGTGITIAGSSGSLTPTGNSSTFNITVQAAGVLLFEENFTASSSALTSNGWSQIGSTSTNPINTGSGNGLSYSNYGSSSIGNAAIMGSAGGQDVYKTFTSQNPGAGTSTVYYSCMVDFSSVATGDYFICLGESSSFSGSAIYRGRVYAKVGSTSSKVLFSISTNGTTTTYGTNEYDINIPILLVVKHVFTTSTSTSSLFINPSVISEPVLADLVDNTASTVSVGLDAVVLRQGGSSSSPGLKVDGVRVGTNWGAVLGNPQYDGVSNINAGNYNNVITYSGSTVSQTGNVIVNGTLTLTGGTLAAGSNTLTLNGPYISGTANNLTTSSSSNLIFNCTGTGPFTLPNFTALNHLTINSSGQTYTLNSNQTISGNLTITAGNLTIPSSKSLTVNGTLTNSATAAGLVIKSDGTGTGSLITSSSPQATVERYLTNYSASDDQKFHLISSPVAAQAIRPDWVANTPAGDVDFYKFDEVQNLWINSKLVSNPGPPIVYEWNSAFESDFTVGRGYLVSYPTIPGTPRTFAGALNSYPVGTPLTINCSYTSDNGKGWNLLGNPFPSAIDWNTVSIGDGMDAALYYYDAAEENYRYYILLDGEDQAIGGGSRYIPAMQGFMVHAKSTGTRTVTIDNDDRVHQAQTTYYKSSESIDGSLSLKVEAGEYSDEVYVHFNSNATAHFDGKYDAYKLNSYNASVPKIYTVSNDSDELAINGLPALDENTEVPVYFKPGAEGTQVLTADVSKIQATVYLLDLKTATTHNLTQNPVYSFTSSSTDNPNRFELKFGSVGIENPVENEAVTAWYSNGILYLSSVKDITTIHIFNIQGQPVVSKTVTNQETASVSLNLPVGIYVAQMVSQGSSRSVKIIVNK